MDQFFAQLFGLYFIIVGVIVFLRRKAIMPVVREFMDNRALLFVMAILELIAGLSLVLVYKTVAWSVPGIISLIGYMMVIEGLIYLAAPARFVQKFIRTFNTPTWFMAGGILSIVAGAYLASVGFGLFK
jgi:uncharacterized membrane protein